MKTLAELKKAKAEALNNIQYNIEKYETLEDYLYDLETLCEQMQVEINRLKKNQCLCPTVDFEVSVAE